VRGRGISQLGQAVLGPVQYPLARRTGVLSQSFQVIFDTDQRISQMVQLLRRWAVGPLQYALANIVVAGLKQAGGTAQRDHRQRAANLRQQPGQWLQVLAVVVCRQIVSDQVFDFFQTDARFLDHQLVDLHQVGGRQAALFALRRLNIADHTGQCRFDIEQGRRNIHQHRIRRFALALSQALHHRQLINNDFARLTKPQHGQGVGDLAQRRHQAAQFRNMRAITAHKQVEALLDPHQLFTQCRHHRTHCVAVGAGQSRPLLINHCRIGHGLIQLVVILQREHFRRRMFGLRDVKQQAGKQLFGRGLVDGCNALLQ